MMNLEQMFAHMGYTPPSGPRPTSKFIKLPRGDDGGGLADAFFEDPRTFVPPKNSRGEVQCWGLFPYDKDQGLHSEPDVLGQMGRQMKTQFLPRDGKTPERQWLDVMMEKKRRQLTQMDVSDLAKRDFVLEVNVPLFHPKVAQQAPVTRRLRCSGDIALCVFQDKVLMPALGFCRNLHAYTFTALRDGALFGPENPTSVDSVHAASYLYDFGDKFFFDVEVVEVFERSDSTGEAVLLSGTGACPGENMSGNFNYGELIDEYLKAGPTRRNEIKKEILQCPNYSERSGSLASFDPLHFDILAAQRDLGIALGSKQSVRSGAKIFTTPIHPSAGGPGSLFAHKGDGFEVETKGGEDGGGYWQETKSTTLDKKGLRACKVCGKSRDLMNCSRCKLVSYCSAEHQKYDWSLHKIDCKKLAAKATATQPTPPPVTSSKPSVGHIFFHDFDPYVGPMIDKLKAASTYSPCRSPKAALEFLKSSPAPAAVLITDADVINKAGHRSLMTHLVDFARKGGRVVFGGEIASYTETPKLGPLFKNVWGLPWDMSGYHRTTHQLQSQHPFVKAQKLGSTLPVSYSMKSVFLHKVAPVDAVYRPGRGSQTESHVFPASKVDSEETPVAMGRVGDGWLAWVGDVNVEEGTQKVTVALLGGVPV